LLRLGLLCLDLQTLIVENLRRLMRLRKLSPTTIAFSRSQSPERLQSKAESTHGCGALEALVF
jgi:hypothetical protein